MGVIKSLLTAKVSGNVGSMNFRKRGSQIVAAGRSYTNRSKGFGASYAQRLHRCKLANYVNFFRAIRPAQIKAWQGKPENVSDFNMLVKYNLADSEFYLTKDLAQKGAFACAGCKVSMGTLAPVPEKRVDAKAGFNFGIELTLATTTKVSALSAAIVAGLSGFLMGDQITMCFIDYTDMSSPRQGVENPVVHIFEITLSADDDTTLGSIFESVSSKIEYNEGTIGWKSAGALCFGIHTRKSSSGLLSSTQYVYGGDDATTICNELSTPEAIAAAVASYGCQEDVFLSPNV